MGKYYGYQEFVIATLLNKYGLTYKNEYRNTIPDKFLEAARRLLTNHESEIQDKDRICVIKDRTSYKEAEYIDDKTCPKKYKMGYSIAPIH